VKPDLAPTPRLRWVERPAPRFKAPKATVRVLQQWWAPDVPSFMRDDRIGEWREVALEKEA
jgi:hypothetical protein